MGKKVFFLIIVFLFLFVFLRNKKQEKTQQEAAIKHADNIKKNNVRGHETLDTPKYGRLTFSKATYDELLPHANSIAKDLKEVNNGHWDTWGSYQKVEDLDRRGEYAKLWYLGYLIKRAMNMADSDSLAARANRENWRMLSWTYLSRKDSNRLAELGTNFVQVMGKVGH